MLFLIRTGPVVVQGSDGDSVTSPEGIKSVSRRTHIQRQRVDPAHQIGPKCRMHRPVPRNPGHRAKSRCPDHHIEMRLPALAPAAMASVAFAVIHDFQRVRLEGGGQSVGYFIGNSHFSLSTPLVIRKNT